MGREPDWESLNEMNFILYNRIADSMNAALSAMAIAEMPESSGKPPKWWYDRSKVKIEAVLNLVMAWSWLIQYKNGTNLTEKNIVSFNLNVLLDWLTINLQLVPPLRVSEEDVVIEANQHTLQEAILLLHSVATTQGTGVTIIVEPMEDFVLFSVRFSRIRRAEPMSSVGELLQVQGDHWRQQTIAFELKSARDFLAMNNIPLEISDDGLTADFRFSVFHPGKRPSAAPTLTPTDRHHGQMTAEISRLTIPRKRFKRATSGLPTVRQSRQHWHIPAASHQADPLKFQQRSVSMHIPDPVPEHPLRPGSWHAPLSGVRQSGRDDTLLGLETPVIVSLDLPEPTLPSAYLDRNAARESVGERFEADDAAHHGLQAKQDNSLESDRHGGEHKEANHD
ncbi:MAG: hypothetical protein GYB66_00650 [Chloroflexi bacterium]|nr:hypothetical protein [Chloroflexota bacterium]